MLQQAPAQVLEETLHKGWVAEAMANSVREAGGALTMEDLVSHKSDFVNPIKTTFEDLDIHEIPPSGQDITALLILNIMQQFRHKNKWEVDHNSAEYLHVLTEALRLAFTDAQSYAYDLDHYAGSDSTASCIPLKCRIRN
uniref:Gammaglutamyltranspeptidase putative n=1 Tax=Albugo laibachii Nc14 TaxID=890382 RepID=F0WRX6_9STRA|nr:gammaglutamyltranspeptidase putative [Albugo laibachii Nc14]|eukprot:CCA24093.1 gammaglutamyltranspeptidase putative [Albugo laibachii Nc14]